MSSVSDHRPRPQPIQTSIPPLNTHFLRTRMVFKDPSWSVSPSSPLKMTSSMLEGEDWMKKHERTTTERLEPLHRPGSPSLESALQRVSLKPISALNLPSPRTLLPSGQRPPLSAPLLPSPEFRRQTIVEETRDMLLHEPDADPLTPSELSRRRQSAPPGALLARNMQLQRHRDLMRRQALAGMYQPREPDLLVVPVEHRRLSTISPMNAEGEPPTPLPKDGHVNIRVVVHSRGKKPAILTRNFDLDELRATVPPVRPGDGIQQHLGPEDALSHRAQPPRVLHQPRVRVRSPIRDNRRASMATLQSPTAAPRAISPGVHRERRLSSASMDWDPSGQPAQAPGLDRRSMRPETSPAPMHLEYARAYLPVLAAIILSDMVRRGDIVELPLPHPRAWKDTVAYVYTGRVALTEPIRQNILYLGGKA